SEFALVVVQCGGILPRLLTARQALGLFQLIPAQAGLYWLLHPARKDYLLSNTPPSPVGLSIQRSALLFVVLVLVLGALLLAANSIDPKASQRPGINYAPWTSSDDLISIE